MSSTVGLLKALKTALLKALKTAPDELHSRPSKRPENDLLK
jgi:hypothetical protein